MSTALVVIAGPAGLLGPALAIAEALAAAGSDEVRHVILDAYQKQFHGCGWAAIAEAGLAGHRSASRWARRPGAGAVLRLRLPS
jgi:hypothetical protein